METVSTFGIVGTGIIGAGWAARALASGLDVLAYDPGVDAKAHLEQKLRQIWPVLERTGLHPKASNAWYSASLSKRSRRKRSSSRKVRRSESILRPACMRRSMQQPRARL